MQVFDVVLFVLGSAGAISYGPVLKVKLENCVSFHIAPALFQFNNYFLLIIVAISFRFSF